jgi:photosystem II stability/assembly factor-like uncharacterized protein
VNESTESRNRLIQTAVALLFFALPFLCGVLFLPQPDVIPVLSGLESISVHQLTVTVQDGRSIFHASTDVGVFRSEGGDYWEPINTGLPLGFFKGINIKTLVADPHDPALVYVLVRRDDGNVELYRTTNAGKNWHLLTLPDPVIFEDTLTLSSGQDTALYLLGSGGVYQSHDGQSWKLRETIPGNVQPQTLAVVDSGPSTVFYLGTQENGVLRSDDKGDSWEPSQAGLEDQTVQQLLVSPANSNILFALADQKVYRSTDAGGHWQFVGQDLETQHITSMIAHPYWEGVVYLGTAEGRVLVTADTGDTWKFLGDKLKDVSVQALAWNYDSVRIATNKGIWRFERELVPGETPATAIAIVTPIATPTNTPRPSATPTAMPTATATSTPSPTPSPTPTNVPPTATASATATATPLPPPTNTPLPPPTDTPLPTPTHTPPPPPTHTPKPPTSTPTPPPTNTPRPTAAPTSTNTPTPTPTTAPTFTPTPTITPGGPRPTAPGGTVTPSPTPTSAPTITPTVAPTNTPAFIPTATPTYVPITTPTDTPPTTPSVPPTTTVSSLVNKAILVMTTKHPPQHDWTEQTDGYALDRKTGPGLTSTYLANEPLTPPLVATPAARQALVERA